MGIEIRVKKAGNSDKSTLGRKSLVEVQPIRCKPGDIDHACKHGGLKCPDDAIETGVEEEINGGPVAIYSPICKAVVDSIIKYEIKQFPLVALLKWAFKGA